jgi:5-methylcytosine-specific restriction endonuclease McrA
MVHHKQKIPKAIREQVWLTHFGKTFDHKCYINWCTNIINVFDFQVGHNKPESKGGTLAIKNLHPICSRCNQSMSNNYTITAWNGLFNNGICGKVRKWFGC